MVEHIVAFESRQGSVTELVGKLRDFCQRSLSEIDGIEYASAGENLSPHGDGFDVALAVRLRDRSALETYVSHPLHQAVAADIRPLFESRVVIDYEG